MGPKEMTKGADSLRKALSLLELTRDRPDGVTVAEMARASGLARPTVYRMVAALEEEDFLRQDDATRRFSLGPKLLDLAQTVWRDGDLRDGARPVLDELAARTGAAAILMVPSDRMATCIELGADHRDQTGWKIGKTLPITDCAGGLALLAYGDWGQLDAELSRLDVDDPNSLKSQLGVIRSRFYAVDQCPTPLGAAGVAAPVFDFSGSAVAAVCLYGEVAAVHELGAAVVQAARVISRRRGGYPFGIDVNVVGQRECGPDVTCLAETACLIGDSPVIKNGRIAWIDILAPAILTLNEVTGALSRVPLGEVVGAFLPLAEQRYLIAQQTRMAIIDAEGQEQWCRQVSGLPPGFRYNDGATDAKGRVWLGAMDMATSRGTGLLHRYDTLEAEPSTLPGFSLPNGIAFSDSNDRMFVIDSMDKTLSRFRYDVRTGVAQLESCIETLAGESGRPSGLARGPDDTLFTCHWDGAEILHLDADGRLIQAYPVPVPRPSGVAFDRAAQRLVVTSARVRLTESDVDMYPLSGSVFQVRVSW